MNINFFTKECAIHDARDFHHLPAEKQIYYTLRGKTAFIDTLIYYTDLPKILHLPDAHSGNPYHALFEMISRFYYFDSGDNEIIYYFPKKGYMIETLLAYLPKRFKREFEKRENYEYIDFPGLPEKNGELQHAWGYAYVKELLLPLYKDIPQKKNKFVYISRSYPQNKLRGITNEKEVIQMLRPMGFSSYTLEHMTVEDTVELFCSARFIIAAHGAGLAWSLFCHPETIVLEIYPDSSTKLYYFHLARHMNLEFYRFTEVDFDLNIGVDIPENLNFSVRVEGLEVAVRQLLTKIDLSNT